VADNPSVREFLHAAVSALGGVERPGQVQMAEAVADAMRGREHLLVQAGTGTGKSLAYLVPALLHKGPVVVSTATLALQAQLVGRDLPRLADAVEPLLSRPPSYAILKGRRNYLCKQRVYGGMPDEGEALFEYQPTSQMGREVQRVRSWAEETESGDRDELSPGVSDRAWGQVAVSSRECIGASRCPYGSECFAELARERAAQADVVVTNHALLAIDALENIPVLPEHDTVVVDEAHELVDRVTGAATSDLTPAAVERAAKRAARLAEEGLVDGLLRAGESLGDALAGVPAGRLTSLPSQLGTDLAALRDAAAKVLGSITTSRDDDPETLAAKRNARAAVEEVRDVAARLVECSAYDVVWVSVEERRGPVLRVAPLSVAGLLREALFSDRTVVLTSATLELGGSFEPVARGMGLGKLDGDDEDAPSWQGLDVGSPFDYARQGILYVARQLPAPGRDGLSEAMLDELDALVSAAGGRTLGLFSSRRAAEQAVAAMRERLEFPVLCQGEDSMAELVRRFAADPACCLFGTLSLWQGVDVPGSACQLVVVDRIPFPRPDDPLMSARARAVDEAGGNGFMAVSASYAALKLAQGSGRLIRSAADRGVVAVLDSRLERARYAGFLRRTLPPFWYTTDRSAALAALQRIDESAPPPLPVREVIVTTVSAAPMVAVPAETLGRRWSSLEDSLLRAGVAAGRSLELLTLRHDCSDEQLLARIAVLELPPPEDVLISAADADQSAQRLHARWSEDEDALLRRLVETGASESAIADHLERTLGAVRSRIGGLGFGDVVREQRALAAGRPPRTGQRWTTSEDDELRTSFGRGALVGELASAHQRSVGAVAARLTALGLAGSLVWADGVAERVSDAERNLLYALTRIAVSPSVDLAAVELAGGLDAEGYEVTVSERNGVTVLEVASADLSAEVWLVTSDFQPPRGGGLGVVALIGSDPAPEACPPGADAVVVLALRSAG
jgi:ATP-dependent DNA helicase DinG